MAVMPGRAEARWSKGSKWIWTAKDPVAWHRILKRANRRRAKQAWKREVERA